MVYTQHVVFHGTAGQLISWVRALQNKSLSQRNMSSIGKERASKYELIERHTKNGHNVQSESHL